MSIRNMGGTATVMMQMNLQSPDDLGRVRGQHASAVCFSTGYVPG